MMPDNQDALVAKVLADIRRNINSPVAPRTIMSMLFRIGLKEYCDFLASLLPVDDTDYHEVYQMLVSYSGMEARDKEASIVEQPLTVGLMIQKAADFIYHNDEYSTYWNFETADFVDSVTIGEYIVDMLLVKPVVLMDAERSSS